jgi:putative phosphoesterase
MLQSHRFVVLSDTHVGDRARRLDPGLLKAIADLRPETILHCGDACRRSTITELETIAPVRNVQGNRDWLQAHHPPMELHFEVNGVKIVIVHGHLSMWQYILDHFRILLTLHTPFYPYFRNRLVKKYPHADLILYGHTHTAADDQLGSHRLINVGAGYPNRINKGRVEFGLLTVSAGGTIDYKHFAIPPTKA